MNVNVKVEFPLLNRTVDVPEGTKVSDACALAGYPLNLVCGGKGTCKKCAVEIEENGLPKIILSCQETVHDGMRILLKEEEQKAQILTSSTLDAIEFEPSIQAISIPAEKLKVAIGENDWDVLKQSLPANVLEPDLEALQQMSLYYHHSKGIKVVLNNNTIVDVLPGSHQEPLYGIAFDIGTTSVVGYLYNMDEQLLVGIESTLNKQTELGGDVISRIDHAIGDLGMLARLQKLAVDSVNEIIDELCKEFRIDLNNIYIASIGGNSTMQHLFLGLYPEHLGKVPFSSTTHKGIETKANRLSMNMNPRGVVSFLPLLGGFVGADTTAVLLSLPNDGQVRLMIDLGTNGEIAVGRNKQYMVSSTACGPALEGAGIKHGMRGTRGAIEKVDVENDDLTYKVIGNEKPRGICGSGVIDLMAVLFREGVINKRGAFVPADQIANEKLAARVQELAETKVFVIAYADETEAGEDIYFSQLDVRQVQLAKGAIYTGCVMLLDTYGIQGEALAEIVLAGAFGNYIDIRNAQSIGMLPWYPDVAVRSIGNAAGTGSQMHLISKEKQLESKDIEQRAEFVELANDPSFAKQYMRNTYFLNLIEE
jgi:uncharacterized 2Fe-2S/4Fe-4S cluster protein (DUF4445 family)